MRNGCFMGQYSDNSLILLSTSTFWFWRQPYDAAKSLELIMEHRPSIDGVDIWFFDGRGGGLPVFNQAQTSYLRDLPMVSLHTDFYDIPWAGQVDYAAFEKRLVNIRRLARQVGAAMLVIHADMLVGGCSRPLDMLADVFDDCRVCFEFMDAEKAYGNRPEHFRGWPPEHRDFGLVLDTAHLQDFEARFSWREFMDDPELVTRLAAVHASNHSKWLGRNWYRDNGFNEIEAVHSFCTADAGRLDRQFLAAVAGVPVVVEGIVPPGPRGLELLEAEIAWLRGALKRGEA